MDSDQRDICNYLKTRHEFVSARDICRHAAGKWRVRENADWALEPLNRLHEQGIIETDKAGCYRLAQKKDDPQQKKWVSPNIRKILEKSGRNFEHIIKEDA